MRISRSVCAPRWRILRQCPRQPDGRGQPFGEIHGMMTHVRQVQQGARAEPYKPAPYSAWASEEVDRLARIQRPFQYAVNMASNIKFALMRVLRNGRDTDQACL